MGKNSNPHNEPDNPNISESGLVDELRRLQRQNEQVTESNSRMRQVLEVTKEEIEKLRQEVEKLKAPPLPYGIFVKPSVKEGLAVISVDGKHYEVFVANEDIKLEDLHAGTHVLLNGALNIIDIRENDQLGDVAKVIHVLEDKRLIIKSRENDERVAFIADSLKTTKVKIGDNIRFDSRSQMVYEILPKSEVEEIVLEEVPEVKYGDIGGLDKQIEIIRDSIELPYVYGHLFKQYKLKPPKGILLYGPPGCGKTLVAKAVAYNLSARIKRFLEENLMAIEIYQKLQKNKNQETVSKELLEDYEKLKTRLYEYESLFTQDSMEDKEILYDKLDKSGIIGDFIRRMEGDKKELKAVANRSEWLELLVELRMKGFGSLDHERIGEMLERKRKKYFMKRGKISDREYISHWLENYFVNNNISVKNLESEKNAIKGKLGNAIESYFLNIKGPELLNKYVGETEYRIREVFLKAKEKASFGLPVIVFFDEMESIFRTRGSGISSDMESTIVPMFLSEIDGVESLENVIVIGASNRQDLIDPAVLRPGRLDVKIKIDRPDKEAAIDIFSKYMTPDLPLNEAELEKAGQDPEKLVRTMINEAVEDMYATKKENEFLRVTYRNGDVETLYFKDFASGAMIEGIVSRTKKYALKRMIKSGNRGIRSSDLLTAIRGEYKENEDLPNTTNPDDWSRISGRKGDRIISIETLMPTTVEEERKEAEEIAVSSRYL
ncbi:MAG: hypothetical protein A2161_05870 [Candidatus Schekmanbacteria bacterium RBG_13_48_7]|uniref:AAA+ ATPase domain-containing protein n=1 Tax=Candidatus Schekmanbacteria bacterium RBG_13_48_7 TaxID=1817878 RepID=A0A1F7RSK6_9BACT|nr:MAG: hypothetical protein A2161_05870 [Candidatus Schekmanbacteria bacterium RBG_13_48_7]